MPEGSEERPEGGSLVARTPSRFRRLQAELMALGIDRPYLARLMKHRNRDCIDQRMAGNVQWSLREMYALMDLLRWPYDRMHELFPREGKEEIKQKGEDAGDAKACLPCGAMRCPHLK